jgi:4'-phosphopantetheinyl transferase
MTNLQIPNTLYILNITCLEDEDLFGRLYERMPEYRKNKIDAFKPHKSKLLSLGAGVLLDRAMKDIGITDYEPEYKVQKKPYIKGREDVFFNISHSGDVAVLGLSGAEIGVDIEHQRHFENSLINYVFTGPDQAAAKELSKTLDGSDEIRMDKAYTRLWTVKESIMKHSGKGIYLEPKAITVTCENGRLVADSQEYDCASLCLLPVEIDDYQITICSRYEEFSLVTDLGI